MIKPRKGKRIQVMPPLDDHVRIAVEAIITDLTRDWVLADVRQAFWRFRAGTGVLCRPDGRLQKREYSRIMASCDARPAH